MPYVKPYGKKYFTCPKQVCCFHIYEVNVDWMTGQNIDLVRAKEELKNFFIQLLNDKQYISVEDIKPEITSFLQDGISFFFFKFSGLDFVRSVPSLENILFSSNNQHMLNSPVCN